MHPKRHDSAPAMASFGGSFEATRRRQLTLGLNATPAQRLRWLEEMMLLAHRTGALQRHRQLKLTMKLP